MASLDIFHMDPFKTIQLTAAIEKVPYLPDGLEAMNIFTDSPIRTKALMVEERDGKLVIVPFSDRGSAATERTTEKRKARYFEVPRLRHGDTIYADEVAAIREFGQETMLMQVQKELGRRMVGPTGLRSNLRFTQEYHRLAAVQGYLLNADGSVKFNWFDEFGITPNPTVAFNLAANVARTIRPIAATIVRSMKRRAQGAFIEGRSRVIAICGDAFYDGLVTHTDVEKTYANWLAAATLRQGTAFTDFQFADVTWINYRGSDDTVAIAVGLTNGSAAVTLDAAVAALLANGMQVSGPNISAGSAVSGLNAEDGTFNLSSGNWAGVTGTYQINVGAGNSYSGGGLISIPTNQARFFPAGAPGIFQRGLAPAESIDWVNTLGKPEYAQMIFDRDRNEWVRAELSVYPLHICTRPEVLFSATMDAAAD